jgi:hypothetical protein
MPRKWGCGDTSKIRNQESNKLQVAKFVGEQGLASTPLKIKIPLSSGA